MSRKEKDMSEILRQIFTENQNDLTPEQKADSLETYRQIFIKRSKAAGLSAEETKNLEKNLSDDFIGKWVDNITTNVAMKLVLDRMKATGNEKKESSKIITDLILDLVKALPKEKQVETSQALKEAIPELQTFSTIRQGVATNRLTKIKPVEGKNTAIDPVTGTATISKENFIITIPYYGELAGLKNSSYRMLDAITIALTESGAKSPTVIIPLSDYMKKCGLSDRKSAKEQAKADMDVLRQLSITWEEKQGNKTASYKFVNIADSGEIRRNGDIVFTFGNTFYNVLLSYPVMPYPPQLLKLNAKRNPNSFSMGRKIAEHKNMNAGKKNENIISVKTLLDCATDIPSYKEVANGDRAFSRRIIDPFERDLNALSTTFSWKYCHSNSVPLTREEIEKIDYNTFQDLLILVTWHNYPDQTIRLESKENKNTVEK